MLWTKVASALERLNRTLGYKQAGEGADSLLSFFSPFLAHIASYFDLTSVIKFNLNNYLVTFNSCIVSILYLVASDTDQ